MLCNLLSELGVLRVAGEDELARCLEEQSYNAVILDAGAVVTAATAVTKILERNPSTEVYVITTSPHWRVARDVLRAGAVDYLPKSRLSEDLFDSLRDSAQRSTRSDRIVSIDGDGS